jgi:hypothetical protein
MFQAVWHSDATPKTHHLIEILFHMLFLAINKQKILENINIKIQSPL